MKKVIFTFDGGGLYAIGPLQYLKNTNYKPDYFVGTSAGAIIALLAALPEDYSWQECYDMFMEYGPIVFKKPNIFWKLNPWKPKFDNKNMIKAFSKVFKNYRMCDLAIPTTIILTNTRTGKPEIVDQNSTRYILDVLLDTTAAPTVFEITSEYCDGSLSSNNPSIFAIINIIKNYKNINDYNLVSFNTNGEYYKGHNLNRRLNLLQYIYPVIDATFSSVEESSHILCKSLFDEDSYMRISTNENWSAIPFSEFVILKDWPKVWQKVFEESKENFIKITYQR